MPKQHALATGLVWCATASAFVLPGVSSAQFDASDTQRVGNTQFGNNLDPTGWMSFQTPDPMGMSYLHPDQLRTPTGSLYPYPLQAPAEKPLGQGDWTYHWLLQFGYLHTTGDHNAAFFQQYSAWKDAGALGMLAFSALNRRTGQYVEFRGSRINEDNQYYRLRMGTYGSYRVEAFFRDIPHVLSTNAYPLWNGVGSTHLTLPSGITPGASTQAQVAAVEAGRPRRTLQVTRESEGVSWEGMLGKDWIGYAGVTNENRHGQRDWGGSMFFSYYYTAPGPGGIGTPGVQGTGGGQNETVRPVDFTTTDVNIGMRNKAGAAGWRFNFTMSASFFRDHKDSLSFAAPFAPLPGSTSAITGGTFSLEPDNNYYNVRLEGSHPLSFWRGEFSATASYGSMRQNDALQSPLDPSFCPSGQFIGTTGIACSSWNTTAALSQQNGNARIDTGLVNLRASFRPLADLNAYINVRWRGENNMTRYTMYNPLTGQYGFLHENGSQTLIVGNLEAGLFQAGNPLYQSFFTQFANIPYSYNDRQGELGGTYQVNSHNSLGLTYTIDRQTPQQRERTYLNDQHLKLTWDSHSLGESTLRFSYEYEKRTGSPYNSFPYMPWYSPSLPGYVQDELGIVAYTVSQMYKYDMSDLKASKLKAILTTPLGNTATLTTTLYGNRNHYGAQLGRQSASTTGADVSFDWTPSASTTFNGYLSMESSRIKQGNVADNESLVDQSPQQANTQFGGPMFPFANFWTATDTEKDANVGASISHVFTPRVKLDVGYNYTYARGVNGYDYASTGAITPGYLAILTTASIGNSFPANIYRLQTLTANLNVALTSRVGLRLYGQYGIGRYADWHYTGFDNPGDLVIGNRVYTDLGPQTRWHAAMLGAFVTLQL